MKWPVRSRAAKPKGQGATPLPRLEPRFRAGFAGSAELAALWTGPAAPRDAIGMLAQELLARHVSHGRRGLALCASSAGAGVTFTTAQLGLALAHLGVSTLILEANLQDPRLDELIRPTEPVAGLLQYLQSPDMAVGDVVCRDVAENLSIVYAGGASPDSTELLESERLRLFVGGVMRDFDVTLVDTPGANRSVDSRWLGHLVGYALVIGRRDMSFVDDLAVLVRELHDEGVEIVGSVMNAA